MNRCYVAGPMRGIKDYNFPAFDQAKHRGEGLGWTVISPADMDREQGDQGAVPGTPASFRVYAERDIKVLLSFRAEDGDAIALLPGWENSIGAQAEFRVARWLGLRVLNAETFTDLEQAVVKSLSPTEVRVVAPTGGEKGEKLARFDLLPWDVLTQDAELYGKGAKKYAERNWENGYPWHLAMAALLRHLTAFWQNRESIDEETGAHHLACARFHLASLMRFERCFPELDDRPAAIPQTQAA